MQIQSKYKNAGYVAQVPYFIRGKSNKIHHLFLTNNNQKFIRMSKTCAHEVLKILSRIIHASPKYELLPNLSLQQR